MSRQVAVGGLAVELGDAEIEQPRAPVRAPDQDVAGLDVAVDHQVAVRVRECVGHPQQQADACAPIQLLLLAVLVERDAVDILHRQVQRTVCGLAAIDQLRDVRVAEARENLHLRAEAFAGGAIGAEQQLDRDGLLEAAGHPLCPVHRAHAAAADQLDHLEGADARARRHLRPAGLALEQRARQQALGGAASLEPPHGRGSHGMPSPPAVNRLRIRIFPQPTSARPTRAAGPPPPARSRGSCGRRPRCRRSSTPPARCRAHGRAAPARSHRTG